MMREKTKTLLLNPKDNVASALAGLSAGEVVTVCPDREGGPITIALKEDIPLGHKFALRDIRRGEKIIKFGMAIGTATAAITLGTHVSEHNLE